MPRAAHVLLLLLTLAAGSAQAEGLGLRLLKTHEPVTGTDVPFAVIYPAAARPDAVTQMGPYAVQAQLDAPIAKGRHALILLSHGHGGSKFGHHDLAEALARHGYAVAMPDQTGDSYDDLSGAGTDRVLLGRAWQASATISAALADPRLKGHLDAGRIGAAGFSAGGYTALLLVGAHADFWRFKSFCEKYPKTPEVCPTGAVAPPNWNPYTIKDPPPTVDARVRAAFSMAPLSLIIGDNDLKDVRNPVFLYASSKDQVLLPEENARRIRPLLPNLYRYREIEGAEHYVFLPPCPQALAEAVPQICTDPPGVDRAAVHRQVNADAVAFFDAVLK
ncbi:alpha/beta hydrolase family protein [Luteimonas aquatica]|uniref:alpha/beta hydrolase family protein n=1 Tax=Luteimonas aquatica TaxID=450364 RepID=UPI001F584116|nr:hypothetical protein [Luteimonas aquatica]